MNQQIQIDIINNEQLPQQRPNIRPIFRICTFARRIILQHEFKLLTMTFATSMLVFASLLVVRYDGVAAISIDAIFAPLYVAVVLALIIALWYKVRHFL
jgi:hypothetical protein